MNRTEMKDWILKQRFMAAENRRAIQAGWDNDGVQEKPSEEWQKWYRLEMACWDIYTAIQQGDIQCDIQID